MCPSQRLQQLCILLFSGISKASLQSPVYGNVDGKCEVSFAFHKKQTGLGALRLNVYTNVTNQSPSKWQKSRLWSETSSFGDDWQTTTVGIGALRGGFILEFEAIRLVNTGDMAIDDVVFKNCKSGSFSTLYRNT